MVRRALRAPRHAPGGGVGLIVLRTEGLGFEYDDGTSALDSISFALEDGEKVAVIGPNGAGKSTLLHLIAGFRMPFRGKVTVSDQDLSEKSADELRKSLGLLFQDPDDQIFMPTVEEDVAFGPINLGLDRVEERVMEALRSAGIEPLAKKKPHRLSHGMKKRVAIAGVLAMDPKILLMDEPTAGLDPRSRTELVAFLRSMKRSMVIATHDLEAVAEIADRVILLDRRVLFDGPMSGLMGRADLLAEAGLEPPQTTKLFARLRERGYEVSSIPTTLDQAVAEAEKVVEREKARSRRP